MYILDYSQAQSFQLSNDAFFYLLQDEEPLDEDNLEEALEIMELFPNGFEIQDNWQAVKDTDLIEAVFVPYRPEIFKYDEYFELTKYQQLQIKRLDNKQVKIWRTDSQKNLRDELGEFSILINKYGLEYLQIEGCIFFLKRFKRIGT